MTWKSTAVVSGAGLLATWLASYPPASAPAPANVAAPAPPPVADRSDISEAADRLEARVRSVVEYREPARNPFRFRAQREVADRNNTPAFIQPMTPQPALPAEPLVRLSGIAVEVVESRELRTAILNGPEGLVFAREGEQVAGYRVAIIRDDSVELVAGDGSRLIIR